MSEKITYSFSAQVANGPRVQESGTLEVEAYDKTQVSVADAAADLEVNIQPDGAGLAQFLAITATAYHKDLTYKVNSASSATEIALNGPQVLVGTGVVGLLDAAPTKLFFSNGTGADVTVNILVGRDATPSP